MKPLFCFSLLVLTWCASLGSRGIAAETDAEVQARSAALELAGAFSNDGFKIRDGRWVSTIEPKQPRLIQVNLYAGNEYWFIAAANDAAKRLEVTLYDETGKPLATEPHQSGARAAAGFSPEISGPYYVRIEELEGNPASVCLLYSYK